MVGENHQAFNHPFLSDKEDKADENFIEKTISIFKNINENLTNFFSIYDLKTFLNSIQLNELILKAKNISSRHGLMIEFILNTGIRVEELSNLLVEDIDISTSQIMIRAKKKWKPVKKSFERNILCDQEWLDKIWLSLDIGKERKTYLFSPSEDNNKAYNPITIINMINKCSNNSRTIGTPIGTNILRRTFAYNYINKKTPFFIISNNLGHMNLKNSLEFIFDGESIITGKRKNPIYKSGKQMIEEMKLKNR